MIKFEEREKDNVQGPEGERGRLYGDEVLIRGSVTSDHGNHSEELELSLRSLGNHRLLLKYDRDMIRSAFSEETGLERGRNGCRKVLLGDTERRFPYCTEDLSHFLVLLHAPTKLNTLF